MAAFQNRCGVGAPSPCDQNHGHVDYRDCLPDPLHTAGVVRQPVASPLLDRGTCTCGPLASHYLAAWLITRLRGRQAAEAASRYVAPVGEEKCIARAWRNITPLPAR